MSHVDSFVVILNIFLLYGELF